MSELVESASDRRRGAELALQDDDVAGGSHLGAELSEDSVERLALIGARRRGCQNVARPAELVMRLLQAELTDVARDRGLGDGTACSRERVEQLDLRPDALARNDALDQTVRLSLAQLHTKRIRMQCFRQARPGRTLS